jgi:hypothetical protein
MAEFHNTGKCGGIIRMNSSMVQTMASLFKADIAPGDIHLNEKKMRIR